MQQQALRVLVTGANKGIGYGILENALSHPQGKSWKYLMGVRRPELGDEAAEKLRKQFPDAQLEVRLLDVSSKDSVTTFVNSLQDPIDILVNNAGVFFPGKTDPVSLEVTMQTNYHGTKYLTDLLLQKNLIRPQGKILIVSSGMGKFGNLAQTNPEAYAILNKYESSLTIEELESVVRQFETEYQDPTTQKKWNPIIYASSKLFVSIYSYLLGKDKKALDHDIQVYALCPGFCITDMTKNLSAKPLDTYLDGGRRVLALMTLSDHVDPKYQGRFFNDQTQVESLQKSLF